MKILYLVPHVPNPTKARSYFQVRGLLEAGHDVTVATIERSAADAGHIRNLQALGAQVLFARLSKLHLILNASSVLFSRRPFQSALMWSDDLMQSIEQLLASDPPDVIHVEHLRMTGYGLRLVKNWPLVWDAVDYLAPLFQQAAQTSMSRGLRLASRLEAARLAAYERWLTQQFPATLVISQRDQLLFQADNPAAQHILVTLPGLPLAAVSTPPKRADHILMMTGTLNYHPNIASIHYFVREVLPSILRQRPDVHLQLVGANPTPSIQMLQSQNIDVIGFVPSVTSCLLGATIAIAPVLYAAGMQNKVIEAFLTATPVVATSVALSGLAVKHEQHVLVADTPEDFVAAVLRLLDDADLRSRIGAAGRQYIEDNHDLVKTTQRLVEIYEHVVARAGDF